MEGRLLMSHKELQRKTILEMVKRKDLSLVEGAQRMELSYRQSIRVYRRFVSSGDAGLVHRSRSKPSNRARPAEFRAKVIRRYKERYAEHELGPTLAAEKLAEDGLHIDHETLRRWLLQEDIIKKHRKSNKHRSRRERRAHFGELVQMDGSHHAWFGEDRDKACLMNMVDDATSATMGFVDHQETTEAAMTLLRQWIERYGVPRALYTDKKNVYITDREPTLEEQLAGEEPMTAFGKACKKLGIEIIPAHSPQAKGRVERSNGTYQDRLVKELALRRIKTCATANKLLQNGFTDKLNEKFAVAPVDKDDYHRALPRGLNLDDVFCFEEYRVVQNDWCVRHKNRYYQILKDNKCLPRPKDKVLVRTHLDSRVELLYRDKPLKFQALTPRQLAQQQEKKKTSAKPLPQKAAKSRKPSGNHPWRDGCTVMRNEPVR